VAEAAVGSEEKEPMGVVDERLSSLVGEESTKVATIAANGAVHVDIV
jgi:hypothetical protein